MSTERISNLKVKNSKALFLNICVLEVHPESFDGCAKKKNAVYDQFFCLVT